MSDGQRSRAALAGRRAPAPGVHLLVAAVALGLLVLWSTSCVTPRRAVERGPAPAALPTTSQDPEVNRQWSEIQRQVERGAVQQARDGLEQLLQQHPADPVAPQAALLLARLRLEAGDVEGARRLADVLADGPAELRGPARLLLARIGLQQGKVEDCAHRAAEAQMQAEQPDVQHEATLLAGECLFRQGQHAAALKSFSAGFASEQDPARRGYLHSRARACALEGLRASEASSLRGRVPGELAESYLGLRAAQEAVQRGNEQAAAEALRRIEPWFAAEGRAAELQPTKDGLNLLERRSRPHTVAALLPLTGPSRRIGSAMLDALLVAARVAGPPGPGVRLEVLDTGGDPARAARLVEELAGKPEMLGVVGPFDAESAAAAAARARALGLPLVHVTVDGVVPAETGPVFRAYTSNRKEAHRLAEHAIRELGLHRAAILRPRHSYGETLSALFREGWTALGGSIAGEVTYPAHAVELKPVLDELSRLGPFEALFIPDGQEQVGLIAPHLAARGWWPVASGQKPPEVRGKKLNPLQLLGTSAWYDPRLLTRAGGYLEGAVIACGFAAEDSRDEVLEFVEEFERATGKKPTALDAFARDAFRLLASAAEGERPLRREEVPGWLRRPEASHGTVTSLAGFDEQGEPTGSPFLVQIARESFHRLP